MSKYPDHIEKTIAWAKDGSYNINVKDYEGEKRIYFPHIGVPEWDEMFYQNMLWNADIEKKIIWLIWQGPWKLQYHNPLSISLFGEWGFEDIGFGAIKLEDINGIISEKFLTGNITTKVNVDDIAVVPNEEIMYGINEDRYDKADTSWPIVVVEGMDNPYGKPYRCIDGRRRIHKIINLENKKEVDCYILSTDDIRNIVYKLEVITYEQAIRKQRER